MGGEEAGQAGPCRFTLITVSISAQGTQMGLGRALGKKSRGRTLPCASQLSLSDPQSLPRYHGSDASSHLGGCPEHYVTPPCECSSQGSLCCPHACTDKSEIIHGEGVSLCLLRIPPPPSKEGAPSPLANSWGAVMKCEARRCGLLVAFNPRSQPP